VNSKPNVGILTCEMINMKGASEGNWIHIKLLCGGAVARAGALYSIPMHIDGELSMALSFHTGLSKTEQGCDNQARRAVAMPLKPNQLA